MQIREASIADTTAIAKINMLSYQSAYRGIYSDDYLDSVDIFDKLMGHWQDLFMTCKYKQIVLIAENDNRECIGYVRVVIKQHQIWGTCIETLHIHPSEKGKGVGTALMVESARYAATNEPNDMIYVLTYEQNLYAKTFYEHLNGKVVADKLETEPDGLTHKLFRYAWDNPLQLVSEIERKIHTIKAPLSKSEGGSDTKIGIAGLMVQRKDSLFYNDDAFNTTLPQLQVTDLTKVSFS